MNNLVKKEKQDLFSHVGNKLKLYLCNDKKEVTLYFKDDVNREEAIKLCDAVRG